MSTYYKYNFVSPEPIFARVKEELRSYFDSGLVDDLLFPAYVNDCLNRLGKSTYKVNHTILEIFNYYGRLPDDFSSVREAWLCANVVTVPFESPNGLYVQSLNSETIQVEPLNAFDPPCSNDSQNNCGCSEQNPCIPVVFHSVYKTVKHVAISYVKNFLLKPGNRNALKYCGANCLNIGSESLDTFDIRDNKFYVSFASGHVYLMYYAYDYDEGGVQLVPDNFRIRDYIEKYIKYKVFENLINVVHDESFNILREKLMYYKSLADEAFVLADIEIKKKTPWDKVRDIARTKNYYRKFDIG